MNTILFLAVTLIVIGVLFALITYASWWTPTGSDVRYYYYGHAIVALGVMLALIGFLVNWYQGRRNEQNEAVIRQLHRNENYWIDLERTFMQYPKELNRLYKQMWPKAADVQSLPDLPVTPVSQIQETHAANMLLGAINSINASVTRNAPPSKVLEIWQRPENRPTYKSLSSWMQSDIINKRWENSTHRYEPQMQVLVDALRSSH